MGKIKLPAQGALISGITFSDSELIETITPLLEEQFGTVLFKSPVFDFTMTDYYAPEMGDTLKKVFWCFSNPIELDTLPEIKHATNEIELRYAGGNAERPLRRINIDPGYVTPAKLVLASTKDYSHRVYIGYGIFAETTLQFVRGMFVPFETTYPDYKTELAIEFFNSVRDFVKRNAGKWTSEHK